MKKTILLFPALMIALCSHGQGVSQKVYTLPLSDKGKSVKYNGFGMGLIPSDELMIGANHISYRKIGFGINWRVSIRNYQINKEGFSTVTYENAVQNNWLTGKTKTSYSFSGGFNLVIPITKKIPVYFGVGAARQRNFVELQSTFAAPGQTERQLNPDATKFILNYSGGIFVPIFRRLILNLGYDHVPQTVFVGLAISSPFNYEDIDMW